MDGWFWFWVAVCTVLALVVLGFGAAMVGDFWEDSPVAACVVGVLVLVSAAFLVSIPWLVKSDDDWRQRCAQAGGVVVATDTYWTDHYACLKGVEVINV